MLYRNVFMDKLSCGLKYHMRSRKLTQFEIAKILDINASSINRWVKCESCLSFYTADLLACAFDCDIWNLLEPKPYTTKSPNIYSDTPIVDYYVYANILSDKLTSRMREYNVNPRWLSNATGLSRQIIYYYMNADSIPNLYNLYAISESLETDIEYFRVLNGGLIS